MEVFDFRLQKEKMACGSKEKGYYCADALVGGIDRFGAGKANRICKFLTADVASFEAKMVRKGTRMLTIFTQLYGTHFATNRKSPFEFISL